MRGPMLLALLFVCLFGTASSAFEPFLVEAIEIDGLQRTTRGTVLNYLDISVGDEVDNRRARAAVRDLFKSEFFRDVTLLRDGSTLVVKVVERPTIAEFDIEGNKKVGGDELKDSLAEAGLAEGKVFRSSILDQVERELREVYFSNGFYGVNIAANVDDLPNNRVGIKIVVDEGDVTEIKRINIVGNKLFDDDTLLEQFTLRESSLRTFFGKRDQYSQQKLFGDLETLNSFYQDRGYIRFNIDSVQVSISPDKEDIYITVNLTEGNEYKVADSGFSGNTIIDDSELRPLILQKQGDVFSRGVAQLTSNLVQDRLANEGYAFAEVNPVPTVNDTDKTVEITYQIQPGRRVYVRRIGFTGNGKTNDETLRREMRLLEGGLFSTNKLKLSQARLSRLPYVEDLSVDTLPVPGADDQIDVDISITERAPGSVQFGVGFSENQGFLINGSLSHSNFRGSGNRVSISANNSETTRLINFAHTNPYATPDGVGRTFSLFYRETDGLSTNLNSNFATDSLGAAWGYSFPISETNSWNLGFGARDTEFFTFANSSVEVTEFARENGSRFQTYTVRTGLSSDTRNRAFFPTRGSRQSINVNVSVPFSDLEYYRAVYDLLFHVPMGKHFTLEFDGDVGYADSYGDTTSLPPFENFFAGGATSVRGYEASSLGPRETLFFTNTGSRVTGDAYGGQLRTVGSIELILPTPLESNNRSTRFSLFLDGGNVFAEAGDWKADEIRTSAGLAFRWLTPILGQLSFSYAFPLNEKPGDEVERFQFIFGVGF